MASYPSPVKEVNPGGTPLKGSDTLMTCNKRHATIVWAGYDHYGGCPLCTMRKDMLVKLKEERRKAREYRNLAKLRSHELGEEQAEHMSTKMKAANQLTQLKEVEDEVRKKL